MTCFSARSVILDLLRGASTEADRLRLEQHLSGCDACRRERSRWGLVETVRDLPVRSLGPAARARVLRNLVVEAADPAPPQRGFVARRPSHGLAVGAAMAAAAALVVVAVRAIPASSSSRSPAATAELVSATGQLLGGEGAGTVRMAGAQLWYAARSSVRLTDARRVDLLAGEVEVEVTPGGPGRFRVYAPGFIVEVLGTRFIVGMGSVRTLHGTVRVLDAGERELRVVRAGESWVAPTTVAAVTVAPRPVTTMPAAQAQQAALPAVAAANPPMAAAAAMPAALVRSPAPRPAARSASALLVDAARALAKGRTVDARREVRAALLAAPLPREHARADLLLADAERIDRQPARALAAYRLVAERWSHLPEGEQALFLTAQLQAERGDANGARAAFEEYLSRYPSGRFQELAESRLATLRAAP